ALLRVLERQLEGSLRETRHLRADADAALVECLDRDLVALAGLAERVLLRHAAALQDQLAGRGSADPELVLLLADAEAGIRPLHQEARDPLVALRGIERRHHDEQL